MTERPILMSAPMVRATLSREWTKTKTRRVIRPQPPAHVRSAGVISSGSASNGTWWWLDSTDLDEASPVGDDFRCPYGVPGDRLWVREAHRLTDCTCGETCRVPWHVWFDADASGYQGVSLNRLRPSIHMPRWASRITLEVTDVSVERLQDISRGDAMEEGCPSPNMAQGPDPRQWYAELWGSINGPDSWAANPWVWVVSFRRLGP